MIRFSRSEDCAIILVNKLVQNYNKSLVPLSRVAKEYKLSILFLRKIAHELKSAEIIKAVEGKKGGYFLQKNPKDLKVGEVLKVFSKIPMLECCSSLIGKVKICPRENYCEPGFTWRRLNKEFLDKIFNLSFKEFLSL